MREDHQRYFRCHEKTHDYMDNFRVARLDNPEEMAEYKRRFQKGCCGFHDRIVEFDDGPWLIGFNYGH